MSRSLLHLILRRAEAFKPGPEAESDADLTRRFAQNRDESAFAELLRRHGPMVWAVCRHLLPDEPDAEDAFQATFLALIRSAGSVRNSAAVSSWLHGVAVRVSMKVKRSAARRRQREARAAEPEADRPVPAAAWNALLAAVHEEVQKLPDSLRAAFVLCELEGVRQPEAAVRLGWKPGTLTGRLTRARQLLVQRLSGRGLAPSLAGGSLGLSLTTAGATVPESLIDSAMSLNAGGVVSPSISNLMKEVAPMTMRAKLIAATVVIAGGLSAVLFPVASAQFPGSTGVQPGTPPPMGGSSGPAPGVGGSRIPGSGAPTAPGRSAMGGIARAPWDYSFVAGGFNRDFVALFTQMGNDGWEYCGSVELSQEGLRDALKAHPDRVTNKGGSNVTLIFKRERSVAPRGRTGGSGSGSNGSSGGSGFGTAPGGGPPPVPGVGANPFGGSGLGGPGGLLGAGPGAAPAKEPLLTIFALKNAPAVELEDLLGKVFKNITITSETRTNSLIIRADDKTLEEVKSLIQKLDVPSVKP